MKERAILVSGETALVGVHSLPGEPSPNAPMLLFWNTGMLHRIGPNRAYVELARSAAALGYASIRFDLSGIGDSPSARGGGARNERVIREIQSVMEWAVTAGHTGGFVLVGLCSGADDVHHVALADDRVRGAVCVDGYTFTTPRFWRIRLANKIRQPAALLAAVLRRIGMASTSDGHEQTLESEFAWAMPDRAAVVRDINNTTQRGMYWFCVYTREVADSYNYENQFVDMLPGLERLDHIKYRYMKDADHTLSSVAARASFSQMVLDWIVESFS